MFMLLLPRIDYRGMPFISSPWLCSYNSPNASRSMLISVEPVTMSSTFRYTKKQNGETSVMNKIYLL